MKSTVCFFNSFSQESEANYLWYLVPQDTLMECCQSFMDWTFFFRFWMYELQVNQCDKQHCPRHYHYKSLAKIYDFFNKCKKFFFIWVFVQIDFQNLNFVTHCEQFRSYLWRFRKNFIWHFVWLFTAFYFQRTKVVFLMEFNHSTSKWAKFESEGNYQFYYYCYYHYFTILVIYLLAIVYSYSDRNNNTIYLCK